MTISRVGVVLFLALLQASARDSGFPTHRFLQLRFSPDGKYLLAQDYDAITVLTVAPFVPLFRIQASNNPGSDSRSPSRTGKYQLRSAVLPRTPPAFPVATSQQVERWSISTHERISTSLIDARCGTEGLGLSPDGRVLACVDSYGALSLVDVTSGRTLIERKRFGSTGNYYGLLDPSSALLEFSPDGRYLVAFPCDLTASFAWDLRQNRQLILTGKLRDLNFFYFAFLSSDRVVMSDIKFLSDLYNKVTGIDEALTDASVAAFPSGRVVSKLKIPPGRLFPAADPGFVILRPIQPPFPLPPPCGWWTAEHADGGSSGAIDVSSGQAIASPVPVQDVFGPYYAGEQPNGDIGLYQRGKGLQATVSLQSQ